MSEAFKIIQETESNKIVYPKLPFVIKDEYGDLFLVVKNTDDSYTYVNLTYEETGLITELKYNGLDEMFENNPSDIILETELKVIGKY